MIRCRNCCVRCSRGDEKISWGVLLSLLAGRGRDVLGTRLIRGCSAASALLFLVLAGKVFLDGLA